MAFLLAGDRAAAAADLRLAVAADPGLYEAYLSLAAVAPRGPGGDGAVFDAALSHAQGAAAAGEEFTCEDAALLKLMGAPARLGKFPVLLRELVSDYADCGGAPGRPAGRRGDRVYS